MCLRLLPVCICDASKLLELTLHVEYFIFGVRYLCLQLTDCVEELEVLLLFGDKFLDDFIIGELGTLDSSDGIL